MRALAALLVVGCMPSEYTVRQAANVSHIEPTLRTGAPLEGPVQFVGHASAITAPKTDGDSELYVSRFDLGGGVRARVRPGWDLDALGEVSSRSSFQSAAKLPDQPGGTTFAFGVGSQITMPLAPRWWLAFAVEVMAMSIPYHLQIVDNSFCPPLVSNDYVGRNVAWVRSLAAILRWQPAPQLGVFGSFTIRNQPQNGPSITTMPQGTADIDDGPAYGLAALGADMKLSPVVSAQAIAFVPFGMSPDALPVDYRFGFILGVSITVPDARHSDNQRLVSPTAR